MINNIEFKNYNGYLKATIDGQTLPLQLKEIIKDKVSIHNNASTGLPLYTPIPINVSLTTEHDNIIEKGLIRIQILNDKEILHEEEGYLVQNKYKSTIDKHLPLGTYIVKVFYSGDKYFEESTLQYYLTIEKRALLFKMDKVAYHGKPYEDINVHIELYDMITKVPIINTRIDYIYDDIHYITKSDNKGAIDFQITVPTDCQGDIIKIYVENEVYEYTFTSIEIITDRLDTEITNKHSFEENNIVLNGNVFAYNKDTMYNVLYGDIELYIEDELVDTSNVENGMFKLTYGYKQIISEYSNTTDTSINEKTPVKTKTKLDVDIDTIPGEGKFIVTVTDYNNRKIINGMVYFQLKNEKNHHIVELDENGQAICYFYLSEKKAYKIKYKYFGIFEYEDSEMKEEVIEVK